jgi:hypothetical protein
MSMRLLVASASVVALVLLGTCCKRRSELELLAARIDRIDPKKQLSNRKALEKIAGIVWRDAGPTKHRISLRPLGEEPGFRLFVVQESPWNGRVSMLQDRVTISLLGGPDPGDIARCKLVMAKGSERGLEEILFARRWTVLVRRKRGLVLVEPVRFHGKKVLAGWPAKEIGELGKYHLLVSKTKRRFELTQDELARLVGPHPDAGGTQERGSSVDQ